MAIAPVGPFTVTQPKQNKFGAQGNQVAHASRNTPESMAAKTILMRIATAANSKGSRKREIKQKHVLVLTN